MVVAAADSPANLTVATLIAGLIARLIAAGHPAFLAAATDERRAVIKRRAVFAITLLLALWTGACNSMSETKGPPPTVLEWDLSNSHNIKDVNWPADQRSDYHTFQGDIHLTLKLSEGRIFRERLRYIHCRRIGNTLRSLRLHTPGKTLNDVYVDARRLIEYWKLEPRNLDEWHTRIQAKEVAEDRTFQSFRNDLNPAIGLKINHSFDDAQPWYVLFSVSW